MYFALSLRRLKTSVLDELPPRHIEYVDCIMDSKQAAVYRDYEMAGRRRIRYRIAKGFEKAVCFF